METMGLKPGICPTCIRNTSEQTQCHSQHWHLLTVLGQMLSLTGSGEFVTLQESFQSALRTGPTLPLHGAEVPSFCVSAWTPWQVDAPFPKHAPARTCFVFHGISPFPGARL